MPSRSASERQSMTMASSRSATSRQSDVSISVQDYSLERPRGSTPPVQSSFCAVFSDMRGSLWIVGGLVHTWEAFFGCLIAIASTLLCYFFEFQNDTSAVSTILGVVIVFPITALIGFAFSRREAALAAFSKVLGNNEALLGAVCTWQKFQDGEWRRVTDGAASERALVACCRIAEKASRYCATPRGHRTRYVLSSYHSESETLNHLLYLRKSEVGSAIQACRRLVQQLKVDGLPGENLCGNQTSGALRLRSCVCSMAWSFHAIDATLSS